MATQKNIEFFQGDSFEWLILVTDVNGDPLDMTGYTGTGVGARGSIRKKYSDANATKTFTISILNKTGVQAAITAGTCHLTTSEVSALQAGAESCYLLVRLSATDTAAIAKGSYVYDIEIQDTTGFVFKPYYGTVTVNPEATK